MARHTAEAALRPRRHQGARARPDAQLRAWSSPPGAQELPPQHGIVLAVGKGVDWWEAGGRAGARCGPGDHVVFPAAAGSWVEVDEERLLVCRITELLGILETVDEPSPIESKD